MAMDLLRNAGLKAFSLGLALLLWWGVSRDQVVERSLRVPLEFQNIPPGLEILGDPPGSVDVRVRGASSILSRVEPGEVIAALNLGGARPGQRLFHVLTDEVRAPFGIQVAQVNPPTVALEFERSGNRTVPVRPAIEGEPAPGFVVGRVTVTPSTVVVVGPESRLARIQHATTEPLSVQNRSARLRDVVTVGVTDATVRLAEPKTATVVVEVDPAPIERVVPDVPVSFKGLAPGLVVRLAPSRVSAVVRGQPASVGRVRAAEVDLFVVLESLKAGKYTLPVKAEPSEQFEVVRTDPATVQARIR